MKVELFRRYRGALAAISAVLLESAGWTSRSSPISGLGSSLALFGVVTILAGDIALGTDRSLGGRPLGLNLSVVDRRVKCEGSVNGGLRKNGRYLGKGEWVSGVVGQGKVTDTDTDTGRVTHRSVSILKQSGKRPKIYTQGLSGQKIRSFKPISKSALPHTAHRHNEEVLGKRH